MRALVLIAAVLVVSGPFTMGCNVEVGIDRTTWACVEDPDCGRGARCIHGVCVPEPTGRVCTARTRSGVSARFEVDGRKLVLTVGGQSTPFDLPSRVVGVSGLAGVSEVDGATRDPVAGCCENNCCAERP